MPCKPDTIRREEAGSRRVLEQVEKSKHMKLRLVRMPLVPDAYSNCTLHREIAMEKETNAMLCLKESVKMKGYCNRWGR